MPRESGASSIRQVMCCSPTAAPWFLDRRPSRAMTGYFEDSFLDGASVCFRPSFVALPSFRRHLGAAACQIVPNLEPRATRNPAANQLRNQGRGNEMTRHGLVFSAAILSVIAVPSGARSQSFADGIRVAQAEQQQPERRPEERRPERPGQRQQGTPGAQTPGKLTLGAQMPGRTILLTSDYHMFRAVRALRKAGDQASPPLGQSCCC